MKKNLYLSGLIAIAAMLIAAISACTNFLDIVPDERPIEADAFRDPNAARGMLYSCYAHIPNSRVGASSLDLRTADEITTSFEHAVFARFPRGNYSASDPVISYWNDLYRGIRQCYILLRNIDNVPGISAEDAATYKAEADFLIGFFHFLLIRMYGPIVIADREFDINMPTSNYPVRSPYDVCVDFVVAKMDEAAERLPTVQAADSYGRATSVIALAIKARMLLYAASPLFNGGGAARGSLYEGFKDLDGTELIATTFVANKWNRAAQAALEAIEAAEAAGFRLYQNSGYPTALPSDPIEKDLRLVYIDKVNSREVIWGETRREGVYDHQNNTTPFLTGAQGAAFNGLSPTLMMVESFYTKSGLPIDKDPAFNYADRYKMVAGPNGNTLSLNLEREPRFNAWIAYHNSYYEVTRGTANQVLVRFRRNDNCGIQGRSNNYSPTGYLNKKGVAPELNQSRLQVSVHYPWPVIRLAELYLNYAEALIESGQNLSTAKSYIDRVRVRAGIPTIDQSWAPIGGANTQVLLRAIVRQERTIELYLENHRFWDVRRWMIAEDFLNKQAEGMNIQGVNDQEFFKVTTVPFPRDFTQRNYLMPIPQAEINRNERLVQNPGY
ncbi:RagB/SusD family nutrient uptake outer membrane protein [Sphingobacterium griseoflavum]|uniref:Membrane protein n=1 Tax=Sphingobacterium griseoflavum TaxID=1474952 RepID=A0ABQ3HSX3_9SPHI|nr:RagB/SusD family nutrient uptake outer membrane protein [Sphingobacterium griseoflavum]GHE23115.1 membrane protein [Sphingobacterium griseoflavum]